MRAIATVAALAALSCSPSVVPPAPAPRPPLPSPALSAPAASASATPVVDPAAAVGLGSAELAAATSLRDAPASDSHAAALVASLTDEVGPRLAGSAGDRAGVAWALRTLAANGLSKVHAEPAPVTHWERGAEGGAIVSPGPQPIALTALGGSVATPEGGLEAEIVEAASLDALAKLDRAAVAGKIVFLDPIMERSKDGSGYGKAVGARGRGASAAAKLGALGVVVRSIGTDHARLPHTGAMRYEDGVAKIPAAALSIPDAELLHRLVARGGPVRFRMSLAAKTLPDAMSANVVGEVPGSESPDEIVLLGAHLDSWDLGTGALDDGAGCGLMIDAARRIAALPLHPRRTVRVVLFANEEHGTGGAAAYAKAHEAELGKHVLSMEADFGGARVYETRFFGGPEGKPAFAALGSLLAPLGVATSSERGFGGADIEPLVPAGVPMLDLRQDGTEYFDVHHTANDTFDKIQPEEMAQASNAIATAAFAAASMKATFGRVPAEMREPRRR